MSGPSHSGAILRYDVANGRFLVDKRTWSPRLNSGAGRRRLLDCIAWDILASCRRFLTISCAWLILDMRCVGVSSWVGILNDISPISLGLCRMVISYVVALRDEL